MRIMMVENENEVERLIGRVAVKIGTLIRLVNPMHILFVKASGDYVDVTMTTGETLHSKELISHIENRLSKYLFLRVHRSYIVNSEYVKEIRTKGDDYELVVSDGTKIPSGCTYRKQIQNQFLEK